MSNYHSSVALLGNIVDYAGTFPPAKLDLPDAIQLAAHFRSKGQHPWLMSKMVLPLNQIIDLDTRYLFESGSDGTPWLFAALGGVDPKKDAAEIATFNKERRSHSCAMWIVSYETKFALSEVRTADDRLLREKLDLLASVFSSTPEVQVFVELDLGADLDRSLAVCKSVWPGVVGAPLGIKIRTGGEAPPTPEVLAQAIALSVELGVPFKSTQGLHHPISQVDEFGFVNVFAALSLATHFGEGAFGQAQIVACLKDRDPRNFKLMEDRFAWGNFTMDLQEIEQAKARHRGSFGSCSIDEPDTWLKEDMNL